MSKTSQKGRASPASGPSSGGRLDQAISDVTSKTVRGIQKYRVVLITLILTVVAVGMGLTGLEKLQESQNRKLSERLYTLLKQGETGKNPTALFGDLDEILDAARGHRSERIIYKDTVAYLIRDLESRLYPQAPPPAFSPDGTPSATPPQEEPDLGPVPEILAKAKEIVKKAQARFPDDSDFQEWAKLHSRAIQSFAQPRTRGSKGSFRTALPPGAGGEASPPAPDASSSDTTPDSVAPEAPGPPSSESSGKDAPSGKDTSETGGS